MQVNRISGLDKSRLRILAGAGHVDLSRLIADEAKVTVDGIGSVIVHPKEALDATMNGVGAILYIGSPREVNARMNGLGTIGQRKPKESEDEPESEEINPDTLQPEYEDTEIEKASESTEVI